MASALNARAGVTIHTGNIHYIPEVMKNVGQTPTEELVASLKHVINNSFVTPEEIAAGTAEIRYRITQDSEYDEHQLNTPEKRKNLKISVKLFVRKFDPEAIHEALQAAFKALNVAVIDSVVLALRGEDIPYLGLRNAWVTLAEYITRNEVLTIGVSDIEPDYFIALHKWAKVKPGIVQINLSNCCVVPPLLQDFTKEHDVQLLTHSDPQDILPDRIIKKELLGTELVGPLSFFWATRYQVHIKCRGVLHSKGYIVNLKQLDEPKKSEELE